MSFARTTTRRSVVAALAASAALALTGCVAGEGSSVAPAAAFSGGTLNIDFATYNPLSLVIKKKGWLEAALKDQGVTVNWVQSAGSNKANEALRSGAIDVGSTAGSAALLARANGSPIKTIDIYSQPEWSALVTGPSSGIATVADLRGKSVAATKGTDPYFFLLQSLAEAGLSAKDVTVQNLQHADGRTALENGAVDAWAGLDPIMAGAEKNGAKLFYRNVSFNSYGFLNANESFLAAKPKQAQAVVNAYEKARAWAAANPDETAQILADVAGLDVGIAKTVILERSNLAVDPAPGEAQRKVLAKIGPTFVETGDVTGQDKIDTALSTLLDDSLVKKADASAIRDS
ncbi:aliphatic sulfonate ABC transporter substrate-binding protein [Arthrobacter sp. AL08]|uniref:aliphatic sulfonate ABC transporter substrate-binding protein n=1 Tax=unclassified Arthrobacter TaxID=235627 RepID=UPI001CFF9867|nr:MULTISPECIES: aliphatic sulfonate ABC transporter substrate-binding protein [unclassified Arthrobacter]MCB5281232.1 putative aliphatic sulfonates-binding protein [Arthrobacter sp. ES1]MDI3241146.1 aliphatic sulfonate ABC transporter substrate-binding protein [Arthrobacter sp. AL05]MDI3276878.1 aliphatic sulfonate ABC transporter substrate-binding protein [Arthrobacter sp. AL08]WGZ79771.1 aliphatic sulfonate ABC transporter substrate-binding protein [Arthrobacter sp. EM1]